MYMEGQKKWKGGIVSTLLLTFAFWFSLQYYPGYTRFWWIFRISTIWYGSFKARPSQLSRGRTKWIQVSGKACPRQSLWPVLLSAQFFHFTVNRLVNWAYLAGCDEWESDLCLCCVSSHCYLNLMQVHRDSWEGQGESCLLGTEGAGALPILHKGRGAAHTAASGEYGK